MNNKHSKSITVSFGDVGPDRAVTPQALVSRFQEVINEHTRQMGVGVDRVWNDFGGKWVTTRLKMEIDRFPRFGEEMVIETWPLKPSMLVLPRVCGVKDAAGTTIVRAYSEWCVLNVTDEAIRRTNTFGYPVGMEHIPDRLIAGRLSNPREVLEESERVYEREMRFSDLDFNGHVNNVADIRLAMDCFSAEELAARPVRVLEMAYASQCYAGEVVGVYRRQTDEENFILQGRTADRLIFTALVKTANDTNKR